MQNGNTILKKCDILINSTRRVAASEGYTTSSMSDSESGSDSDSGDSCRLCFNRVNCHKSCFTCEKTMCEDTCIYRHDCPDRPKCWKCTSTITDYCKACKLHVCYPCNCNCRWDDDCSEDESSEDETSSSN